MTQSPVFDFSGFLKHLSSKPGVYQMLNKQHQIIYVGKAKNLKKRVSSYFQKKEQTSKTTRMVSQIHDIRTIVTNSEVEALLLECNLIKQHRPKYNILLRDDKSYPYVMVNTDHAFPRLHFYRGTRQVKGKLFGPFPNAYAVKQSIELLQKLFKLRTCRDVYFKNRTRPCLQYQIKRCKAPCVGYISEESYSQDVDMALNFLKGKSQQVLQALKRHMLEASQQRLFEQAAVYRDQIQHLSSLNQSQSISTDGGDVDVIGCCLMVNEACVNVVQVRQGLVIGSHAFFPKLPPGAQTDQKELLTAFLLQYYHQATFGLPDAIVLNFEHDSTFQHQLQAVSEHEKLKLMSRPRGKHAKWLTLANNNAKVTLENKLASSASQIKRFDALCDYLNFKSDVGTIECFDISHTSGEATVASCVVFNREGPIKSSYRKFNITGVTPGDDYGAMKQALTRRYQRLLKEEKPLPSLILIDGGKGQLNQAIDVMKALNIESVMLLGVAKGVSRKPGLETLVMEQEQQTLQLDADNPALHLIQHIRDEAHRFAITTHRHKRGEKRTGSVLEEIEGIGSKKRHALLTQFGGLKGVKSASLDELQNVKGINKQLAKKIYDYLASE